MRIAVVSDIHGNISAFEAVLADLRFTSPDLIFHGGDLASGCAGPVEAVDRIRELGWPGVMGNADEVLFRPESLSEFAAQRPAVRPMLDTIREVACAVGEALGDARLAWLRKLPRRQSSESVALVHASPESAWIAPGAEATDAELWNVYSPLSRAAAVYGHIHVPFVRQVIGEMGATAMTVVNSGSVGLPFDGDRRASYVLLDDGRPEIRRVEYDVDREIQAVRASGLPDAEWTARTLASGRFAPLFCA